MSPSTQVDLSDCLVAEIAVIDPAGVIVHRNRKWDETAAVGKLSPRSSGWNYIEECEAAIRRGCNDAVDILAGLRAVLDAKLSTFVAIYSCPFNGLHHWFQVLMSSLDINGARHAVLMHVDVSALQRDPLTGLPNRAMFDAQLDLALSSARASHQKAGIIIIDMNNLKMINDLHGHQAGDEGLKALAAGIAKKCDQDWVAARIGGDEFGVVLPVGYNALMARRLRANFQSGIHCTIGTSRHPISVSASVGIALYPDNGTTASELVKFADASMYAHKRGLSVA